jgi:hypothetical protein
MIKHSIKGLIKPPTLTAKHHLTNSKLLEIFRQAIAEAYYQKNQKPTCLIILLINHPKSRNSLINLIKAIFNQTAKETLKYPIFKQVVTTQMAQNQLGHAYTIITRQYRFSSDKTQLIVNEMINFSIQVIRIIAQDIVEIIKNENH